MLKNKVIVQKHVTARRDESFIHIKVYNKEGILCRNRGFLLGVDIVISKAKIIANALGYDYEYKRDTYYEEA